MSSYCTLSDVKHRLSGDVANMGGDFDATITAIIPMVSAELDREVALARGVNYPGFTIVGPGTPVTRRYTGRGGPLLLIDDAVEVSAVAMLDNVGNLVRTLTAGTDYLPYPYNDVPITGLISVTGWWPSTYAAVSVTLKPGIMSSASDDLHNACIEEVAQVYLASQAGQMVASKLLSIRASLLVESYSYGGGLMRRA